MDERTATIAKMATQIYCLYMNDRLTGQERERNPHLAGTFDDHDLMDIAVVDAEYIMARAEGKVE